MQYSTSSVTFMALLASAVTGYPLAAPGNETAPTTPKFDSNTSSGAELDALKKALAGAFTYSERQEILAPNAPDASNYVFQFVNNTVTGGTGGTIALSTKNNFPALSASNTALAIGFVNPCGLNVPHLHPRGGEFLTVVQGQLVAGLVLEVNDGSFGSIVGEAEPEKGPIPQVISTLNQYQGFMFPQGETHWQFNPTCEPAVFAASFDSADPGRTQLARNFFSNTPDEVLIAAVGGNIETLDGSKINAFQSQIPNEYAVIMKECAVRCGFA
ncbi:RmlC-like cupin domain-containing protein [Plectosphaerella plurivora]|uniref:RmlC-like cupin domain-containing protein n=1 Tax=Plectosphaerella plurivora TaxID=936078 RepID=A0A9P8VBX2_9PEZI|nr:RmlC-like cupin domain-containing protein [Plectosphaerella plurivora]